MNKLTPDNRLIVELLAAGKTVKEIASEMNMKARTIEKRIKTMRKEHNCLTVTQLVATLLTNLGPDA